jgi:DNA-nicking Smr family endonuclease
VSDTDLFALGRGDPAPEERIDLHGARRDAARRLVAKRLDGARARGLRCVLIVHGHGKHSGSGEAILKKALPDWLTTRPCSESVLAFAPAPRNLGGGGATLVLLRRR